MTTWPDWSSGTLCFPNGRVTRNGTEVSVPWGASPLRSNEPTQ